MVFLSSLFFITVCIFVLICHPLPILNSLRVFEMRDGEIAPREVNKLSLILLPQSTKLNCSCSKTRWTFYPLAQFNTKMPNPTNCIADHPLFRSSHHEVESGSCAWPRSDLGGLGSEEARQPARRRCRVPSRLCLLRGGHRLCLHCSCRYARLPAWNPDAHRLHRHLPRKLFVQVDQLRDRALCPLLLLSRRGGRPADPLPVPRLHHLCPEELPALRRLL